MTEHHIFLFYCGYNNITHVLGSEIRQARKNIEIAMEQRRKCIEVTKVRREQTSLKQRKIREVLTAKHQQGSWTARAAIELQSLIKIHGIKLKHRVGS